MAFVKEFKEFALKGNALDMAVGLVLGAAFNKVVTSIVQDILMPPIGMLLGRVDFKQLEIVMKEAGKDAAGNAVPAVAIRYGMCVNTVIEFLLLALSVFLVVRFMNRLIRLRETHAAAAVADGNNAIAANDANLANKDKK